MGESVSAGEQGFENTLVLVAEKVYQRREPAHAGEARQWEDDCVYVEGAAQLAGRSVAYH